MAAIIVVRHRITTATRQPHCPTVVIPSEARDLFFAERVASEKSAKPDPEQILTHDWHQPIVKLMTENDRISIPSELKRQILVEAGHRCAIPTCRQTPVEIAHIIPWASCKSHTFDNLIALCPTCHTRFDNGDIDRKSMRLYKHNLGVLNSRYGDMEQRILRVFSESPKADEIWLPGGLDIMLLYLIRDGLLINTGQHGGVIIAGVPSRTLYRLTDSGRIFIEKWLGAGELK